MLVGVRFRVDDSPGRPGAAGCAAHVRALAPRLPVPHCGAVLDLDSWDRLSDKLKATNIRFVVEPHIRFKGQSGEQATMFLLDPSGNAIEFKAYQDIAGQLFKK